MKKSQSKTKRPRVVFFAYIVPPWETGHSPHVLRAEILD